MLQEECRVDDTWLIVVVGTSLDHQDGQAWVSLCDPRGDDTGSGSSYTNWCTVEYGIFSMAMIGESLPPAIIMSTSFMESSS